MRLLSQILAAPRGVQTLLQELQKFHFAHAECPRQNLLRHLQKLARRQMPLSSSIVPHQAT
jgi:hypothetical protein